MPKAKTGNDDKAARIAKRRRQRSKARKAEPDFSTRLRPHGEHLMWRLPADQTRYA